MAKTIRQREAGTHSLPALAAALAHHVWRNLADNLNPDQKDKANGIHLVRNFTGFVFLIVWVSTITFDYNAWQNLRAETEHDLLGAQSVLRAHVGRTYNAARNMLTMIDDWLQSRSVTSTTETIDDLVTLIRQLQLHDEQPISVRLINDDSAIFRSIPEREGAINTYVGDREYAKFLTDKQPGTIYVSEPIVSRIDQRTVLPVVLKARPNRFSVKYISAVIPDVALNEAFGRLLASDATMIGVLRDDGKVLFTMPESTGLDGKSVAETSNSIAGVTDTEAHVQVLPSFLDGKQAIFAHTRLSQEPLAVFASFAEEDLRSAWLRRILLPTMLALISSIVISAFAFWLLRAMRRNITEADRLALALVDAQAANQSKQQFLANMSHELRTPLNAIIGFSGILSSEELEPADRATARGYARDIGKAGNHLLAIVSDILDAARAEAGHLETGDQLIELGSVLNECRQMLAPRLLDNNLTFGSRLSPQTIHLHMNPLHLRQVLINLIGNAIKFTRPHGHIDVTAALQADGSLSLVIADTGIGIPPKKLGELFKPFSQVDESLYANHDGVGLGLVNTRLIVNAYGGQVWLESVFASGTQAHVVLPASRMRTDMQSELADQEAGQEA
jgi:signal transduction histidine kinase